MTHKHRDFSIKKRFSYKKKKMPHKHGDFSVEKCLINMEIFL